jgi:glycosyltransferase involved in cell wall biosynthesis
MRIAVWHNLPSGGAKRALYDQVCGLLARGHEVEAWCPWTADQNYLPLSNLIREHVVPLKLKAHLESPPTGIQKLHPLYWSARGRMRAMDQHCLDCSRQMEGKGFDLLFAATCMFFHAAPIARYVNLPSVMYLQEPSRSFYECLPELPWVAAAWTFGDLLDRKFWRKVLIGRLKLPGIRVQAREEKLNAMAFKQVLVNSFFSRESLLRAYGIDSKVCYLGVDTDKFVNQNQKREKFVVCVASLSPNKNIEFLVSSLAKIPAERRPKLVLVANIVWDSYGEQVQRLAGRVGVNFELKHRIEDAELINLLNRARMMLYAPRLEPFGYAPIEANACGLPVVAVAEGGVRETVQDGKNGLLVEHEPMSMAAAIERLMVDDELHLRLSQGAYSLAREKWSLEFSLDRLEQQLRTQLDKPNTEVAPRSR